MKLEGAVTTGIFALLIVAIFVAAAAGVVVPFDGVERALKPRSLGANDLYAAARRIAPDCPRHQPAVQRLLRTYL